MPGIELYMIRIFGSFYLFIVVALVGLSALLDNTLAQQDVDQTYLDLLAHSIATINQPVPSAVLNQHPNLAVDTIDSAELSLSPTQWQTLQQQGYMLTYSDADQPFIYSITNPAAPPAEQQLLRVAIVQAHPSGDHILWYRVGFFAALALLVALWSWPIWRDIKKLENGAKSVQADGTIAPIQVRASSSLGVIATALQSLSRQVRDLLNKQRELTSAVAHEFRTPLARLKFALESLTQAQPKASMVEDVNELERLIQEMLEFSQSAHHQPELSFAEIPVFAMVESLLAAIPTTKLTNIHISNQCDPITLYADGHFAERALFNLINNALKYAESTIVITAEKTPRQILITVEDDGPGVPPALTSKIFDAFYRPETSRARHQGGAGLGLATVQRIQHWHQGDCWVEPSKSSRGARFVLCYPIG